MPTRNRQPCIPRAVWTFSPVPGHYGAHGRFDGQSSKTGWITASGGAVRRFIGATAIAGIAGLIATAALNHRKTH